MSALLLVAAGTGDEAERSGGPYSAAMSGDVFAEFERAGWERAAIPLRGVLDRHGAVRRGAPRRRGGARWIAASRRGVRAGLRLRGGCRPGAHPVGVDVATAMVERARARCPNLTFVVGDALRLPFPDASFDAVTMNFGILHVSQPERALAEAHQVLVPDGRLAFTTWVAQGNAEDEITEAALADHAIAVQGPQGPSYHVFADPDECRWALATCGFDTDSLRMDTAPRSGACGAQTFSSKRSSTPESAPQQSYGRNRPSGLRPSARRWPTLFAATRTATPSHFRSPRASSRLGRQVRAVTDGRPANARSALPADALRACLHTVPRCGAAELDEDDRRPEPACYLLVVGLVALDLPGLVAAAGYASTSRKGRQRDFASRSRAPDPRHPFCRRLGHIAAVLRDGVRGYAAAPLAGRAAVVRPHDSPRLSARRR
jgi:SAM-dependent methyltransferase